MEELVNFLTESGTYYFATIDGDQARVRPFGAHMEYEGKIYFCTNNTKNVYKQFIKDPRVEITGMSKNKWIRLSGEVVVDNREETRKVMLDVNPTLNQLYSIGDGIFEVFYLENPKATIYSFTEEPEIII